MLHSTSFRNDKDFGFPFFISMNCFVVFFWGGGGCEQTVLTHQNVVLVIVIEERDQGMYSLKYV